MSKAEKQRDILFEACKKVATNKRTPDWIGGILTQAVVAAKQVPDDDAIWSTDLSLSNKPKVQLPVSVGCTALMDKLDNVRYRVQVIKESEEVEGIKLWHVRIIEGKGPHAIGSIVYNVPEPWIFDVEVNNATAVSQ